jgi:hypothetical protein
MAAGLAVAGAAAAVLVAREASRRSRRSALSTYPPLDTPKPLAPDIWVVDSGPIHPGGIELPVRMTIVRLHGGGLWLHSPTQLTDQLAKEVEALGPVEHLVAPNIAHWTFLADWQRRYPDAVTWAAPGLRDRAQVQGSDLRLDRDLGEQTPAEWASDLDQGIVFGGMSFAEAFFFHRASQALILTDLIQNLDPARLPIFTRVFAFFSDAQAATTPLYVRAVLLARRAEVLAQFERMQALRPEIVIFSHGDCFHEDATVRLGRALGWALPARLRAAAG